MIESQSIERLGATSDAFIARLRDIVGPAGVETSLEQRQFFSLDFSEEPLVSVDFKRNSNSSIVDAEYTKVIGGTMLKVLSWYDNEWGYSCRVRDLVKYIASKGL